MDQAPIRVAQLPTRGKQRHAPGRASRLAGWGGRTALPFAAIILIALLTRLSSIGDPAIHMDEQFYLLVGDRLWQGALPYVDIWDRKPIGLFLIYAALRPLSPDGIIAYQIGALASAIATGLVLRQIVLRFAEATGALATAILYLLFLPMTGGMGGQSPVFYNLPMALAAWFCLKATEGDDLAHLRRRGLVAMSLCGVAIQIKYSVIFEGIFFGVWLLAIAYRRGASLRGLAALAALLILAALLLTMAAGIAYAVAGHFPAFFDANFLSIFRVIPSSTEMRMRYLTGGLLLIGPLLVLALFSFAITFWQGRGEARWFFLLWTVAAAIGFLALGNNYNHYLQPVLLPLCLLCGVVFQRRYAVYAMAIGGCWYVLAAGWPNGDLRQSQQKRINAMAQTLVPYAKRGCIYVNDGPTILYLLTRSCLPTPYIFPEHLNNAGENGATHAPEAMAHLLAGRPSAIMVADRILDHPRNATTAAMLDEALAHRYREVARLPDVFAGRTQIVFVRKDLP